MTELFIDWQAFFLDFSMTKQGELGRALLQGQCPSDSCKRVNCLCGRGSARFWYKKPFLRVGGDNNNGTEAGLTKIRPVAVVLRPES